MMEQTNHLADIATEESVIARLIGNPDLIDEVRNMLDVDSFSSQPCRMLWKAIIWSVDNGNVPDLPFLQAVFRDRNRSTDLDALNRIALTPVSSNIRQQVDVLEHYRKRRTYRSLCAKLMENWDAPDDELEGIVDKAMDNVHRHTGANVLDKYGLVQHAVSVINSNLDGNGQNEVMTGFRVIDEIGGLPPESEVIVAAFSSQGKTAFAMSILQRAMQDGVMTALYSAEQGKTSIIGRFLNMMGWNVPIAKFKTQPLLGNTVEDFNRLAQEFVSREGNIYVDEGSTNSPDYICSSIRVFHRKYGVRLVVVDYLQIISLYDESNRSDQEKLAVASRKFQKVAKELSIVIIVLSQFSRPSKDRGHYPDDDLIRGSGQIYEACDIALYIYRPEKWATETYLYPFDDAAKEGTAMIKIGKYRDGEANRAAIVGFDGPKTLFYEFPDGQYDDDPKKNYPKASSLPTPPSAPQTPVNGSGSDNSLPF